MESTVKSIVYRKKRKLNTRRHSRKTLKPRRAKRKSHTVNRRKSRQRF